MANVDVSAYSRGGDAVELDAPNNPDLQDIETHEEAERAGPDAVWTHWNDEIRASLAAENRFREEGRQAEKDYFGDEFQPYTNDEYRKTEHRTNIIHANIEVLKPLVFSNNPTPIVRRRYGGEGANDPTDRIAAIVGQRMAEYLIETSGFEEAVEQVRDDWLVPGRGTMRIRYSAKFEKAPVMDPATGMPVVDMATGEPVMEEVKRDEKIRAQHWLWSRVLFSATNSWDENRWIAWETPRTRKQIEQRFGEDIAREMQYPINGLKERDMKDPDGERSGWEPDKDEETTQTPSVTAHDQCIIFEIWDKEAKRIVWWSPHYRTSTLDESDDIMQIEGFYDCPKPLLAVTKNGRLTPRPDTAYYRARAEEVDTATRKLSSILKAISVSGAYPGKMSAEITKMLDGTNKMIPIEEWIGFMEKGGVKGVIDWLPLETMIAAAQALIQMREQSKMQLYEISGVSDIVRGQTDPNETLGAQQIKGNYANLRLRDKQRKVHVFCREAIKIMLEMAFEHFDTSTITDIVNMSQVPATDADLEQMQAMTQAVQEYEALAAQHAQATQQAQQTGAPPPLPMPPAPPPPPFYEMTSMERVHAVLRDDLTRKFRLSIETDGTVLSDPEEDKRQRIEFVTAFTNMVQQLIPLAMGGTLGKDSMRVMKEILLFAVRGFPKSQTLEGMISALPDEVSTEPQKDPRIAVAEINAQVKASVAEMEIAADKEEQQSDQAHDLKMKGVDVMAQIAMADVENENREQDREDAAAARNFPQ